MSGEGEHGYAIELYFDPALENQVLKAWNVLARRQISTHLIEMESRPHITLFSVPTNTNTHSPLDLDPSKLEPLVKSFSSRHDPLPLSFSSLASLSADSTLLFLSPTPTIPLLQFQSHLCDSLRKDGIDVPPHYSLDSWIPHCSVAQHVPKSRMPEAFSLLRDLKLPVSGYAVDIGLVQFSPVRELFSFVLGNAADS